MKSTGMGVGVGRGPWGPPHDLAARRFRRHAAPQPHVAEGLPQAAVTGVVFSADGENWPKGG